MDSLQVPAPEGHVWRALQAGDAHALRALADACGCADADCDSVARWAAQSETVTHALGLRRDDELRGALRVRCFTPRTDELLAQLEPVLLDAKLLPHVVPWYEAVVRRYWRDEPSAPARAFRVAVHVDGPLVAAALEPLGYALLHAEDRMRRRLDGPTPPEEDFGGLACAPWSAARVADFFEAYSSSFRERPGFPKWSRAAWVRAFTNYDSFRPEHSMLLRDGDTPVAFLLAALDEEACWVVQMGVVPSHRGRGLGGSLLRAIERRAAREGCAAVMLSVNLDNAAARRLYERVGYERVGRTTVYKRVDAPTVPPAP